MIANTKQLKRGKETANRGVQEKNTNTMTTGQSVKKKRGRNALGQGNKIK